MTHPDTGEKATMSESIHRTEVARAFAQHRFDKAIPHLARDVSWTILGYMVLEGADAVARTCRDTAGSLHDTVVAWERCRTVTEDDTVVVDVLGRYAGAIEHAANAGLRGAVKVAFDLRTSAKAKR